MFSVFGISLYMEERRVHFRHILLFYFRGGKNAAEAKQKICDVYGSDAITTTSCYNWYARFQSGHYNLEDAARSGRPSAIKNDQILELIKVDRQLTAREIADQLGIGSSTVCARLREMGMVKKDNAWVPNNSTDANNINQIDEKDAGVSVTKPRKRSHKPDRRT